MVQVEKLATLCRHVVSKQIVVLETGNRALGLKGLGFRGDEGAVEGFRV